MTLIAIVPLFGFAKGRNLDLWAMIEISLWASAFVSVVTRQVVYARFTGMTP